ncbi:MAG: hypothetical protein PHV10_07050 [Sulfuricurvum sp.]|nr:hypothetical protein [Sulfuricurvum sp.]
MNKNIKFFKTTLITWFIAYRRFFPWREDNLSCYKIIIAEILLQRTKAETVAKLYPSFLKKFPSWQSIASSDEMEVGEYLKPFGLWRQRAQRLRALAIEVEKIGSLPKTKKKLEKLPMMGQYLVNTVLTQCYGAKEAFIDVNMARVLERFRPKDKSRYPVRSIPPRISKKSGLPEEAPRSHLVKLGNLGFCRRNMQESKPFLSGMPIEKKMFLYYEFIIIF